jgi:serine/threonine-protein kinase
VGRYALYDAIARGGMASVHFGRLLGAAGFSRAVAIKRLHEHLAHDPEFRAMFIDEAQLAARIRHANVVPTLDVVTDDDELMLVMEYVNGESLSRLIREAVMRGELPPIPVAISIMMQVLHGLHAAHEARDERGEPLNLVHRDVSPHNILVGTDGVVRVFDFGVAKASNRLQATPDGSAKGKLAYMAPEQIEGHRGLDRRTDVFAASIVLWELVTGKRLFVGPTDGATVANVQRGCSIPPSVVVPRIDPRLDALVMKGLSLQRDARFSTASEMARALEDLGHAASSSAVAEWVQRLGGAPIAARAALIADIEAQSDVFELERLPASGSAASRPASTLTAVATSTVVGTSGSRDDSTVLTPARLATKRRHWAVLALVPLVVSGGVLGATLRARDRVPARAAIEETSRATVDLTPAKAAGANTVASGGLDGTGGAPSATAEPASKGATSIMVPNRAPAASSTAPLARKASSKPSTTSVRSASSTATDCADWVDSSGVRHFNRNPKCLAR